MSAHGRKSNAARDDDDDDDDSPSVADAARVDAWRGRANDDAEDEDNAEDDADADASASRATRVSRRRASICALSRAAE